MTKKERTLMMYIVFDKYLYEDDALAGEKIKKETESNHGLILNIISNEKINSELRANAARIYATHFPDKDSKEFKLNIQNISSNQFPIIRMGILYGLIEAKKSDLIYNFFSDPDSRISKEAKKYFVDGIS